MRRTLGSAIMMRINRTRVSRQGKIAFSVLLAGALFIVAAVPGAEGLENPAVDAYYVVGSEPKTNSSAASHHVQAILNLSREDPSLYAFNRTFFSSRIRVPESGDPGELGPEISSNLWINRAGPGGPPGANGTSSGPTSYVDIQRRITIYFEKLVEFIDNDGNAILSGGDLVIQESPLLEATVSGPYLVGLSTDGLLVPLELSPLDAGQSAGSLTAASPIWASLVALESGAEMKTSVATLNVTTFAFLRPVVFQNASMEPSRIKIDISLQRASVEGTSLAVVTRLVSQDVGIIHEGGVDWGGMRATSDGISSFFIWASTALVDGKSEPVGTTTEPSESIDQYSATVVFAYPPGLRVVHDPELGFDLTVPPAAGRSAPLLSLVIVSALAVAAVAFAWFLRVRLRNR